MEDHYAWLGPSLERIAGLLGMPDRHNSYSCAKIAPRLARSAVAWLMVHMRPRTPAPRIMPTEKGGLTVEWHEKGVDFVMTFENGVPLTDGGSVHLTEVDRAAADAMEKLDAPAGQM